MNQISGILLDIDGVLYSQEKPVEGAVNAVNLIADEKIPFRCISNTTRKSADAISKKLKGYGFSIPKSHIITPAAAVSKILFEMDIKRCFFLVTGDVTDDFSDAGLISDEINPQAVVVGDAGDNFSYEKLNRVFRILIDDSENFDEKSDEKSDENLGLNSDVIKKSPEKLFFALEKDIYWMDADGLSLSAGPFVKCLEYASEKEAVLVGKPSKAFFNSALSSLGTSPPETLMIGDDIISDVGGAKKSGMRAALVKTGKFREDKLKASGIAPDYILNSVADLPEILGIK